MTAACQETALAPCVCFAALVFALGACVGNFLSICIHRIPRDESIVMPRSHCPQCGRLIPWYLNIPILSYVLLAGRCRYCHERISPRYLLTELLTAALFVLIWLKYSVNGHTPPLGLAAITDWRLVPVYWLAASGLILGTFVDVDHLVIPDRVTVGGIIIGLVLSPLIPGMHATHDWLSALIGSALGIVAGGGGLWIMALLGRMILRKEAMGFGDIKLLAAMGAFLGPRAAFFIILISSLTGSTVGMVTVMRRFKRLQGRIPYGPYLAMAAVIWILWGEAIWQANAGLIIPSLL